MKSVKNVVRNVVLATARSVLTITEEVIGAVIVIVYFSHLTPEQPTLPPVPETPKVIVSNSSPGEEG